jgi:hypothetical protein
MNQDITVYSGNTSNTEHIAPENSQNKEIDVM